MFSFCASWLLLIIELFISSLELNMNDQSDNVLSFILECSYISRFVIGMFKCTRSLPEARGRFPFDEIMLNLGDGWFCIRCACDGHQPCIVYFPMWLELVSGKRYALSYCIVNEVLRLRKWIFSFDSLGSPCC